jgi:hypothetical protein
LTSHVAVQLGLELRRFALQLVQFLFLQKKMK